MVVLLFLMIRMRRYSMVQEAQEILNYAEETGTDEVILRTLKELLVMEEE